MSHRSVLGLFTDENVAADAMDSLRDEGYTSAEYEVLTGTPYPEGTFGEEEPVHKLYRWPLMGAACGFIVGLLLTTGTQLADGDHHLRGDDARLDHLHSHRRDPRV